MTRAFSLGCVLLVVWLLLSGQYDATRILLGVFCCIITVLIAHRMDVVDHEGHPSHISPRIFSYWLWLAKCIVRANFDVAICILSPRLKISPRMLRITCSQRTELCQTILANSITLTPGTVTIDLQDGVLLVHALSEEAADDLLEGQMDARVKRVEG